RHEDDAVFLRELPTNERQGSVGHRAQRLPGDVNFALAAGPGRTLVLRAAVEDLDHGTVPREPGPREAELALETATAHCAREHRFTPEQEARPGPPVRRALDADHRREPCGFGGA